MEQYSEAWFRARLDAYLEERHPKFMRRGKLIDRRCAIAAEVFRQASGKG